jgi:UDP-glucose 4-epimerase
MMSTSWVNAPAVVKRLMPQYEEIYRFRGWSMFPAIDRVYVNDRAREELGWRPRYDFARALACVNAGEDHRSELARAIGSKGYHPQRFADGPFPVLEPESHGHPQRVATAGNVSRRPAP